MSVAADESGLRVTSVTLPIADIQALRELAREAERSMSGEVRLAVARHLADQRWVVERTVAWLHSRHRLLIRTNRSDEIQRPSSPSPAV
jgi:hypothetical protein